MAAGLRFWKAGGGRLSAAIAFPRTLLQLTHTAYKSKYSPAEKVEVFKILLSLWVKSTFAPPGQEVCQQQIFGFTVTGYRAATLLSLFKEIFLTGVYDFSAATPQPVILDCGANIGMATLYFKKLYPEARILAFEPNPRAFALLQKNIQQNGLQGVLLYNVALSDEPGTAPFFPGEEPGSLSASLLANRPGTVPVEVKVHLLSEFTSENSQIDLVKIDVEGAEGKILRDLWKQKEMKRPEQYIIEFHHVVERAEEKLSDHLAYFEALGFGYYLKTALPKSGNCQDLVFHFLKATH